MFSGVAADTIKNPKNRGFKSYKDKEIIIKLKDTGEFNRLDDFAAGKNLRFKGAIMDDRFRVYEIDNKSNVEDMADFLMENDLVEYAQPNYIYKPFFVPNDEYYNFLWGLHNVGQVINSKKGYDDIDINASEAWDITKGREEIVVAVIDDGVFIEHPDLKDNIWINKNEIPDNGIDDDGNGFIDDVNGWDFYEDENLVYSEEFYHGTHVAGTIAASSNNIGILGVAPEIKIMPLKFFGPDGGYSTDAIAAIEYAKENGANIVNCSWGADPGAQFDTALKEAIEESGLLFVFAAGNANNDNDTKPVYPASLDCGNIVSVAAIDNKGVKDRLSNYGKISVDLGAPGCDILSTMPGKDNNGIMTVSQAVYDEGSYAYLSGTSMAAPHVSGIAALLLSKNPDLSPEQIKAAIMDTVKPLDGLKSMTVAEGMADAFAALKKIAPGKPLDLKASKADSDINLTWNGNITGDIEKFIVERKAGNGNYSVLIETDEKHYTDKGIDANITYKYRVKLVDEWGNTSIPSIEAVILGKGDSGGNGGSSGPKTGGSGSGGGGGGTPNATKPKSFDSVDEEIIEKLKSGETIVEVKAFNKGNTESVSLTFSTLSKLIEAKIELYVKGSEVMFKLPSDTFDTDFIKGNLSNKTFELSITIEKTDSEESKKLLIAKSSGSQLIGKDIYELSIIIKNGSKETVIDKFNKRFVIGIKPNEKLVSEYGKDRFGIYRYDVDAATWNYKGGLYDSINSVFTIESNHLSKFAVMAYIKEFEDVKDHWAKEDIKILISRHIAEGRNDKYEPNDYITRIELVKMLIKMLGQSNNIELADVNKAPFSDISAIGEDKNYVSTAVREGIIKGFEDGTFKPLKEVSREEMAAMISRMMKLKTEIELSETAFNDSEQISQWAAKDVAAVYEKGIIKGDDSGNFDGKRAITRAEAAVMIKRIMDNTGLIDLPYLIEGKLELNHIEGTHLELVTKEGNYVLTVNKNDKSLNEKINSAVGNVVKVKGYILSGYSIYQRGRMFKVIDMEN